MLFHFEALLDINLCVIRKLTFSPQFANSCQNYFAALQLLRLRIRWLSWLAHQVGTINSLRTHIVIEQIKARKVADQAV